MNVVVRYFASLREKRGRAFEKVDLEERSSLSDLLALLFPYDLERKSLKSYLRVAVNGEYSTWDVTLQPGDEVAFLPPVAGG